jgi:multiple sugar transport system ATP-binding protein
VTHDQIEAMAMGNRIVVMSMGTVQQVGTPADVYYKPANLFVARFIGSPGMNLVPGHYADGAVHLPGANSYTVSSLWNNALRRDMGGKGDVILGFRPEAGWVTDAGALGAEVYATELHGAYTVLHLSLNGQVVQVRAERGVHYPIGETVRFDLDPEMVRFFDPETEAAFRREVR